MCHYTKFLRRSAKRSRANFRFSRWRSSAILDWFYVCWNHPRRVFGGLCDFAKFGCNRCSNFDSMQILLFCALSLKMPIHAPKIEVLWDFTPKMGSSMNETQKGTSLGGNTSYDVQIVKIGPRVRARREPKNKAKRVYQLRNDNRCFFTCSPRPPTLSQRHIDLHVWAYPRRGQIFQVLSKSVEGFRSPRGSEFALYYYFGYWLLQRLDCRTRRYYRAYC